MSEALLEAKDIRHFFGAFLAVDGVSMDVKKGQITALIGANGAGKTTFYNIVSGSLKPSEGRVLFQGQDITGEPPHRIARMGIGRSFQITNIFAELDVLENVQVALVGHSGQGLRMWQRVASDKALRDKALEILKLVHLDGLAKTRAGTLSYGDKRLLELAMVLATEPKLVLLDEPTAGMTPEETRSTVTLIRELARSGVSNFFLTEHDMDVVFGLADRIFVMHRGQLLAEGTAEEIRANRDVKAAYLGEEEV